MDRDFVLRHHRTLTYLPDSNIRRDPSFIPQLYFVSIDEMGSSRFGIYLSQMIATSANETDQSVRAVTFLKRKHSSAVPEPDLRFVIDERAAKLYLSFGNDLSGTESKLRVMHIAFDPADHLGFRRLRVQQEQDRLFAVRITPSVPAFLGAIIVCPLTGSIFGQYAIPIARETGKSTVARFEQESKAKNSVIRAKASDHKFAFENASRKLDPRTFMFTKLNHLLILYGFPAEMVNRQTSECMFLVSYDTELNLVRSLAFDPVAFVRNFLEADLMSVIHALCSPFCSLTHAVGLALDIVGHMHKYVLFVYSGSIMAVKWPRDWYTAKNLPPIQLSRVIELDDFGDEEGRMEPMALINNYLYIVPENKPQEIRRLSLSPRFKDYRHCANCGEIEKRKRRNKEGKRISKFKVCRLCKNKNFHLFYLNPEIACHYCSDECQKKHWKEHKAVHGRGKLDRKTASAKPIEEKFD